MRCLRGLWFASCLAGLAPAQEAAPQTTRPFENRNHTFHLDLPADWRQMAPDEARRLRNLLPPELHHTHPLMFYSVGPVDRWLGGSFDGVHLLVLEQDEEWVLEDDYAGALRQTWQQRGAEAGIREEVSDIRRVQVGVDGHQVIECLRRSEPLAGGRVLRSLDIYAPTGGRQVLLAFRCFEEDFQTQLPVFRSRLETIAFARPARGEASLGDRLWTPILTGSIVGLCLIVLYRWTKRRV